MKFLTRMKGRINLIICTSFLVLLVCALCIVFWPITNEEELLLVRYKKLGYNIVTNIAAASFLTIIYESLQVYLNNLRVANAILNLDAFVNNYIISFSKIFIEMTYEDKSEFIQDVKKCDFDIRCGIDVAFGRSISGKSMMQIFSPSALVGGGFSKTSIENYCDNLEILVQCFEINALQINFSKYQSLFCVIRRIICSATTYRIVSEMRALVSTYQNNSSYRTILTKLLSETNFSKLVEEDDDKDGNILLPYVLFYKHTREMVESFLYYENEMDKIRIKYPQLVAKQVKEGK